MPYPNYHAARIREANDFVRIVVLQTLPNGILVKGGPLKSDPRGSGKTQTYWLPREKFTEAQARKWLKDHDIKVILFEPATGENMNGYTVNLRSNGKIADILLYGVVGGQIDGTEVANEIASLQNSDVTEIHEWINSPGGCMINGYSIIAENIKSNIPIHTHNVGIAASMAGIILASGSKRHSFNYAKMMVHEPSICGKTIAETDNENDKNQLIALKDSIIVLLTDHSTQPKEIIKSIMEDETWISAKEAKNKYGFIDIIDKTGHKPKNDTEVTPELMQSICNEYHSGDPINFDHSTDFNHSKTNKMKNLCNYLDLNEDASNQAVLDAIKKVNDDLTESKSNLKSKDSELVKANETIENQKKELKTFKDEQDKLNKKMVEDTVDVAIKDGKFEEKDKDEIVKKFENNLDGLQLIVGTLKNPAETIIDKINNSAKENGLPEDKKDWGLRKLEKEAPNLVARIKENDIELYKKMYKAEYDVEYAATE